MEEIYGGRGEGGAVVGLGQEVKLFQVEELETALCWWRKEEEEDEEEEL